MAHTAAALSDTTSVTSPTPFSPFSSAYSVSSEATVVSEGQADLGAFQSVFFALTQLQLHHQHHPRSPRNNTTTNTPIRNDDSSDDDNDDDNDDQDTNHGFTRSNTPSLYPVSPLNLDGTVSRSSVHPSNPPSRSQLTHASEGTSGSTDEAVASDIVLAAAAGASSEAAEEGDEESIAMTSPNSHPSSDSGSIPDDYAGATFPDDEGRTWMYAESPYDPSFRPSASSEDSDESPRQEDGPSQGGDEGTSPSLGDMEAAFAFFAAERAKLVKQLEASKSGTPTTLAPALPITNRKNNKRGGGKGHRKNKSSDAGENAALRATRSQPNLPDSDEASLDASPSAVVPPIPITISSSSPDDHTFGTRKNQRRGVFPRPPKQNPKSSPRSNNSGSPNTASLATSILNSASSSQSNIISNNKRNRYANHRHTRSLPIDPQTVASIHQQLQPTLPTLSTAEADKIRQLARRLSFLFPFDTPSLRRVMQNPQGVLGLRSHATPSSDDTLIAEGFFDPGVDGAVAATGSGPLAAPSSALLYVFIDHSNILVGFLAWLKKQGITNAQLNGKPKLSHSALALLIERGRRCLRKVLVASSPLYQSLDEMAGMGYQISVLQRVEIKEGSSRASRNGSGHSRSSSFNSTPNRKNGKGKGNRNGSPNKNNNNNNNNGNNNNNAGSSNESDSNGQQKRNPPTAQPSFAARLVNARRTAQHHRRNLSTDAAFITPSNPNTTLGQIVEGSGASGQSTPSTRPRFREEAVDELLQLKLLQTLLDTPSPPPPGSTIVLASGDAAKSQFNPEGFLGCVRKAVERGWNVEVVGWDEGRSRAYGELANEVIERGLGGMLSIISLDRWGKDLLENLVN